MVITEGLMQAVFGWIRNLTGFFLFMSVMDHLMPEKTYASYIRLFSGMVFILLVLQPITGNRRLEERIAQYYESNLFRYETGELRENLLGIEEKRRSQMVNQYEGALGQEISRIAQADGFAVRKCQVQINQDMDSEQFGEVTGVRVELCSVQPEKQSTEIAKMDTIKTDTTRVKTENSVDVSGISGEETETGHSTDKISTTKNSGADKSEIQIPQITVEKMDSEQFGQKTIQSETQAEDDTARAVSGPVYQKIGELRSRISSYCGVEEQNVEIGIVEAER